MARFHPAVFRSVSLCLLLASGIAVMGCSKSTVATLEDDKPAEQLYNDAKDALDRKSFRKSAELFDEVDRQHPYSDWATRAQLMAAFAQYSALQYDEAVESLDRFISLHPGHEDADYAYYLKALCYYERIADVKRDQGMTENAEKALKEIVRRFPNSEYAADSEQKLKLTRDHLAANAMEIGRFYQRQQNYQAAIGRYQNVVEKYEGTSQIPEALLRLTESYAALGLMAEAQRSAAVLGQNFPESHWYKSAYAIVAQGKSGNGDKSGFFARAVKSLF